LVNKDFLAWRTTRLTITGSRGPIANAGHPRKGPGRAGLRPLDQSSKLLIQNRYRLIIMAQKPGVL
jgi:hypothetical protein